jgi:predicted nucleic acid-binding protein
MIADSNIVIDLLHGQGDSAERVLSVYAAQRARQPIYINRVIFAESASGSPSLEKFEERLEQLGLDVAPMDNAAAFRASGAFREYRRNGGPRTTILPDFLIGAHAAAKGWPILTRDPKRFGSYFPEVVLIDPLAGQA